MALEGSTVSAIGSQDAVRSIAPEDAMRAELYDLLASLLRAAPTAEMLGALSALEGDASELGQAVEALARIASQLDEGRARREYHDLFVGIGRGELVPYGSYYLTGFLHEKPLGALRREMAARGIERTPGTSEPEDHVASLMEMMSGQILGRYGAPRPLGDQAAFFDAHVGSWTPHFFRDLEGAKSAVLYAPVGTIGRALMNVEAQAFAMG